MKTIIAKHSGFCFGVRRAVNLCLDNRYRKPVFTLGPIVHNPQVIEKLNHKGIRVVNNIINVKRGTIIIRAHGIPKSVIDKAKKKRLQVVDATCPFVKKVQDKALELEYAGYQVIILGERDHPEIIGIAGNLEKPIIIENIGEAKKLKAFSKIGLVSQTTQEDELFSHIVKILQSKTKNLKVNNTICSATNERQYAAQELAQKVDLMIVIGGKDSGNTRRLTQICSKFIPTYHIETASELKTEWFTDKNICGITAGASTPNWIIKEVVEKIKNKY